MLVMLTNALPKTPRCEPFYGDLHLEPPPQSEWELHLGGLAVRLAICSQTSNGACLRHPHSATFPPLHVLPPSLTSTSHSPACRRADGSHISCFMGVCLINWVFRDEFLPFAPHPPTTVKLDKLPVSNHTSYPSLSLLIFFWAHQLPMLFSAHVTNILHLICKIAPNRQWKTASICKTVKSDRQRYYIWRLRPHRGPTCELLLFNLITLLSSFTKMEE